VRRIHCMGSTNSSKYYAHKPSARQSVGNTAIASHGRCRTNVSLNTTALRCVYDHTNIGPVQYGRNRKSNNWEKRNQNCQYDVTRERKETLTKRSA